MAVPYGLVFQVGPENLQALITLQKPGLMHLRGFWLLIMNPLPQHLGFALVVLRQVDLGYKKMWAVAFEPSTSICASGYDTQEDIERLSIIIQWLPGVSSQLQKKWIQAFTAQLDVQIGFPDKAMPCDWPFLGHLHRPQACQYESRPTGVA